MLKVGFIGWRGMVGSVLLQRMSAENCWSGYEAFFFSTSQAGQKAPALGQADPVLQDAFDLNKLKLLDIIITCQGSGYTKQIYPELKKSGWRGYFIDTSSALRMEKDAVIVLDPVNRAVIDRGLAGGIKVFVGGNCTVSLALMAIQGLVAQDLVEWISTMTYQAASGAGANEMRELVAQMVGIAGISQQLLDDPQQSAVTIEKAINKHINSPQLPKSCFGVPLAASLIPWIDTLMENGQTREEWKGMAETNKILGRTSNFIPVDGLCVRVGSMRCHSQALTIKLKNDLPLSDISAILAGANDWVRVIPNTKEETLAQLSPAAVSGTLSVPIGRLRKMTLGSEYLTAFTVGDQLLWGAAEPVLRIFNIIRAFLG